MPSTFRSMRAYEMRPDGVRARAEESADSMKHHSVTEVEEGKRGRAHRRSRIPRFRILSNAQKDARHNSGQRLLFRAGTENPALGRMQPKAPVSKVASAPQGCVSDRRSGQRTDAPP